MNDSGRSDRLADGRLPQATAPAPPGGTTRFASDVQAVAERGERGRVVLVQPRDDARVIDEILQRLVVDARQPVAEMRRARIGQDGGDDRPARNRTPEHRLRPHRHRQRDRNRVGGGVG